MQPAHCFRGPGPGAWHLLQLAEDMAAVGGSWVRLMVNLTLSVGRYIV